MDYKEKMKIALVQMHTVQSNDENIETALKKVKEAAENGADLVMLPEMFSCPYETKNFPVYAQKEGGENWKKLSECAKENKVYLVAGSIPEKDDGKIYNTSFIFDRNGKQLARHRKMHLFNCDFKKGGMVFHESETLTAGNQVTTFETEFGIFGVMICFDIRFPELSRLMLQRGARMILVPAAFNLTSGPKWWDLCFRMRATDQQIFMAGCSPCRDEKSSYVAWGHSIVTNPFGEIVAQLGTQEDTLYYDVDFSVIPDMRDQTPVLKELRHDVYKVVEL